MKVAKFVGIVFVVFEAGSQIAEHVHAMEFVGDALTRFANVPPGPADLIAQVVIATAALLICLRIARWIEVRRLVRNALWRKPATVEEAKHAKQLKRYANRVSFRVNAGTIGLFASGASIIQFISHVSTMVKSAQTLAHWSGPLSTLATRFWRSTLFALLAWGCIVLSQRLWAARLRDIDLPADDDTGLGALIDQEDLRFRRVHDDPKDPYRLAAAKDIKQLAMTETYGAMGETDFEQVFEWWKAYPGGNWLADYRGRVVGGVDIWPIRKAMYEGLRDGTKGEEDLEADSIAPTPDSDDGSYWYVGSISLDLRLRQSRYRRAVLARLLETMLLDNFLAAKPAYPVHIIALIWTQQGENIAARSGFQYLTKRVSDEHDAAEPIYERVFDDEAAIRQMAERIRAKLANTGGAAAAPGERATLPSIDGIAPVV